MTRKMGRPARYPWNEWFDGDIHTLTQGVEFDSNIAVRVFRITVNATARRRHIKVRTWTTPDTAETQLKVQCLGPEEVGDDAHSEIPLARMDGRASTSSGTG